MLKIVSVIGARPQFIKVASLSRAIKEFNQLSEDKNSKIKEVIVHTGQHYDYNMNGIFFEELDIKKPDYNLEVGSHSQGKQTAIMIERLEAVLKKEAPHLVIVYGDTNSTLAGALAAKKLHILTAHVEAGLRSFNMDMPEELNRIVVDRISDILFCPTETAVKNLFLEGIRNCTSRRFPRVFLVGDVMYDSVLFYLEIAKSRSDILGRLSLRPKSYYLATIHRAENTDNRERLRSILESLNEVAKERALVVFPVHPRTKKAMSLFKIKPTANSLMMINPVSYLDMLMLEKNAKAILTDSGGIQKEAHFFRVPAITLRDETEWIETTKDRWNVLAGTDKEKIKESLGRLRKKDFPRSHFYGNGKTGKKIIQILKRVLI